jgi:hypothetical protein
MMMAGLGRVLVVLDRRLFLSMNRLEQEMRVMTRNTRVVMDGSSCRQTAGTQQIRGAGQYTDGVKDICQ